MSFLILTLRFYGKHKIKQKDIFFDMSQLEKLKLCRKRKQNRKLNFIYNVIVIDGPEFASQHFLKDDLGNKSKDENGKDKRSEVSDGYASFVNLPTGKMVKLFFRGALRKFELLGLL